MEKGEAEEKNGEEEWQGIIPACKKHLSECHYRCCCFGDNYILLYPGEWEASRLEKGHLRIVKENYFGGKKAVCEKLCGPGDFKPLDCKSFPYFPVIRGRKRALRLLKARTCPLSKEELKEHKREMLHAWGPLLKRKEVRDWLAKVRQVGYGLGRSDAPRAMSVLLCSTTQTCRCGDMLRAEAAGNLKGCAPPRA